MFDSLVMGIVFDIDKSITVGGNQTSRGINFGWLPGIVARASRL